MLCCGQYVNEVAHEPPLLVLTCFCVEEHVWVKSGPECCLSARQRLCCYKVCFTPDWPLYSDLPLSIETFGLLPNAIVLLTFIPEVRALKSLVEQWGILSTCVSIRNRNHSSPFVATCGGYTTVLCCMFRFSYDWDYLQTVSLLTWPTPFLRLAAF